MTPKLLLVARGLVVVAGLAIIIFSARLDNQLTVDRPMNPTGIYTEPYPTHGGTTFISTEEQWRRRGVTISVGVLFVTYSLIELWFKKRRPKADKRE